MENHVSTTYKIACQGKIRLIKQNDKEKDGDKATMRDNNDDDDSNQSVRVMTASQLAPFHSIPFRFTSCRCVYVFQSS